MAYHCGRIMLPKPSGVFTMKHNDSWIAIVQSGFTPDTLIESDDINYAGLLDIIYSDFYARSSELFKSGRDLQPVRDAIDAAAALG